MGGGNSFATRRIRFFNEGGARFEGGLELGNGGITRPATGTKDLLPVAMGVVNSAGTINTSASTANFSISRTGTGTYVLVVTDLDIQPNVVVQVTPIVAAFGRSATYTAGFGVDNIVIYLRDAAGNLVDGSFSFVVYKM